MEVLVKRDITSDFLHYQMKLWKFECFKGIIVLFSGPLSFIWYAFSGCAYTESDVLLVIISKAETVKIMLSLNTPIRRNTPAFFQFQRDEINLCVNWLGENLYNVSNLTWLRSSLHMPSILTEKCRNICFSAFGIWQPASAAVNLHRDCFKYSVFRN